MFVRKKKYKELRKLFFELGSLVWEHGGFRNSEGTYKTLTGDKEILAKWNRFHEIVKKSKEIK